MGKSWTYIANNCDGGTKSGQKVEPFGQKIERAEQGSEHIDKKEAAHTAKDLAADPFAIDIDADDGVWVQNLLELGTKIFKKHHIADHLDPAGGAAGIGTDEHRDEDDGDGHIRPLAIICRSETGGGDDRRDSKKGVGEGVKPAIVTS